MFHRNDATRAALSLLLLTASACAAMHSAAVSPPTTVLIVRHAEKLQDSSDDPHISPAGLTRADELVRVAQNISVDVVYVTQFQRTKETARPVADAHHVPVVALPVNFNDVSSYVQSVVSRIHSIDAGKVIVIVSHSNTVSLIVDALAGTHVPELSDTEYDRLYVVTLKPGASPSVIAAQYGCNR